MPPESLRCKECQSVYPLDARYVCEKCFGPLEVAYAEARPRSDPEALRRRIQAGPALAVALRGLSPRPDARRRGAAAPAGRRCCAPTGWRTVSG